MISWFSLRARSGSFIASELFKISIDDWRLFRSIVACPDDLLPVGRTSRSHSIRLTKEAFFRNTFALILSLNMSYSLQAAVSALLSIRWLVNSNKSNCAQSIATDWSIVIVIIYFKKIPSKTSLFRIKCFVLFIFNY